MKGDYYDFEAIRAARLGRGYEVRECAALLQVSLQTWYRLEHGKRAGFELITRACRLLGLDWREVVRGAAVKMA